MEFDNTQCMDDEELRRMFGDAAEAVNDTMDSFSDEIPEEPVTEEEVKSAKSYLKQFMDYIKSAGFKKDINNAAYQYQVPPKKVAQNFFEGILGTIGDILGVAISTAGNAAHTLIDVLATVAHGAVNILVHVAQGIASFFTLNKTKIA